MLSATCSSVATMALTTALGKQVFDLTGSEFALGMLGLVEFAPGALLVFVTGPLADRYDRRRLGAMATVGQAATAVGLAWYALTDPTSATPIFFIVFAFGVTRAFAAPPTRALPA